MRFRPEQHLRRQSDFRIVREQGRRLHCGPFTFWCLRRVPAPDAANSAAASPEPAASVRRLGVVASTAAVGNAVKRARAKRRLREVFRAHQELVPAGCDVLLSARHAINRAAFTEIERHFLEACRQVAARDIA